MPEMSEEIFRGVFSETLQVIAAKTFNCRLAMNRNRTKFLFESHERPTLCSIYRAFGKPAASWERGQFGDSVILRWERLLGKIVDGFDGKALLREDYYWATPFYAIADIGAVEYLFMVDSYQLPWRFEPLDVMELITSRYGQGLVTTSEGMGGSGPPGVSLHGDDVEMYFQNVKQTG